MSQKNDSTSLDEVRATAESLLDRAASPELAASFLFPYGINRVAISVKSGDAEVTIELSGPEDSDDEDDFDEDDDELWLDEDFEDDEELSNGNGR